MGIFFFKFKKRNRSARHKSTATRLINLVVNEILNGRRSLTAKTALMFEAALDVPADALMYLQTKYNMRTTRNDKSVANVFIRKIKAVL